MTQMPQQMPQEIVPGKDEAEAKLQEMQQYVRDQMTGLAQNDIMPTPRHSYSVSDAFDFLPSHLSNIQKIIGENEGAMKAYESIFSSVSDMPDDVREKYEDSKRLLLLHEGGRNFLSNITANGFKIVHQDQDEIVKQMQEQQSAQPQE